MIERYTLTSLDEIAAAFGMAAPDGSVPRFNIAALQLAPIRSAKALVMARWGLLPPWRGHGGKRDPHVLHAPIEALDQVPLLRNAFKSQRCLVIADGFFVWQRTGKKPSPRWLHPAPDPRIAFAGVAATHRDDGQTSFAIVVGPASPLVAAFDATMPVVIPADGYTAWLTASAARARELLAIPQIGWRADPVSTWMSSVEHDDAKCVEPIGNPAQGTLF